MDFLNLANYINVPKDRCAETKVYNQLRQYEKAESWFHQAVNLKGGTPEREPWWWFPVISLHSGNQKKMGKRKTTKARFIAGKHIHIFPCYLSGWRYCILNVTRRCIAQQVAETRR